MSKTGGFVHGAMLLAGAAVVTKLLGSIYTIVLQNIIGDHGMGLFQMAYPIYATLLAIATAGFPVAISKLVSEQLALGDHVAVKKTFRVALGLLSVLGVITFSILFFGAETWARVAGDVNSAWAIRAIAPALLIVPLMSVIRGYFQGYQKMEPTAASQIVEQFIRVATIIGLAFWLVGQGYGADVSAAGAAFGAVTGAVAGFVLLVYYWFRKHPKTTANPASKRVSTRLLTKRLLYYAFPISLGALVVPLMNNVDVITVVNLLKKTGESQAVATAQFGLLSGRAFKLMMLPTTLATGIGIAVMPAVSEALTLGYRRLVAERIDMAMRLTVLLALPASLGLSLLAIPVDISLFRDSQGASTIAVMAYATLFASVQTTAAAVLQGSGWVYVPVFNLMFAALVKLLGNLLLIPRFGIEGAAAATVISYATASLLNLWCMKRFVRENVQWVRWFIKPLLATGVMGAVVFACERQWELWHGFLWSRAVTLISCVVMISLGIFMYIVALMVTGVLTNREIGAVPKIGGHLVTWCSKLGLIR
jgi:polysaccharide transporter, PST family